MTSKRWSRLQLEDMDIHDLVDAAYDAGIDLPQHTNPPRREIIDAILGKPVQETAASTTQSDAEAMLERELQEQVRQIALANKCLFYHTWDSRKSVAGFPDCVIVTADRRLIFAKLKREHTDLTASQWEWIVGLRMALEDRHHKVEVWRPSDLLDGTIHRILEAT